MKHPENKQGESDTYQAAVGCMCLKQLHIELVGSGKTIERDVEETAEKRGRDCEGYSSQKQNGSGSWDLFP